MKWPSLDESVSLCICLLTVACNREMQPFFLVGYSLWGGKRFWVGWDDLGYGPGSGFSLKSVQTSRQSLSEVWAEALQSVNECVPRLKKNNVLNVKLQRLCKSHHPQYITSLKESEKLEKSRCVRDKAEDLCWMSGSSGPQTTLHHSSAWFCYLHY